MRPMLPRPMTPSVLLQTSTPVNLPRSHLPARSAALAAGMCRAIAIIIEMVCSAVVTLLPSGLFITTMPRRVAASRSTLSTPTPARPITLERGGRVDDLARDLGRAADHQRVVRRDDFGELRRLRPVLTSTLIRG